MLNDVIWKQKQQAMRKGEQVTIKTIWFSYL